MKVGWWVSRAGVRYGFYVNRLYRALLIPAGVMGPPDVRFIQTVALAKA